MPRKLPQYTGNFDLKEHELLETFQRFALDVSEWMRDGGDALSVVDSVVVGTPNSTNVPVVGAAAVLGVSTLAGDAVEIATSFDKSTLRVHGLTVGAEYRLKVLVKS